MYSNLFGLQLTHSTFLHRNSANQYIHSVCIATSVETKDTCFNAFFRPKLVYGPNHKGTLNHAFNCICHTMVSVYFFMNCHAYIPISCEIMGWIEPVPQSVDYRNSTFGLWTVIYALNLLILSWNSPQLLILLAYFGHRNWCEKRIRCHWNREEKWELWSVEQSSVTKPLWLTTIYVHVCIVYTFQMCFSLSRLIYISLF